MIKKLSLYAFALLGCLVLFNSCKKEYESIETIDTRAIEDYIAKNNLVGVKKDTAGGYYYQIITPGTGTQPVNKDSVYYTYNFTHTNGTSILKNGDYQIPGTFLGYTDRFSFKTIPGVRLTLARLKRGGTARVIIPSSMAFGKNGNTVLGVESNEIIVIELGLLDLEHQYQVDNFVINKFVAANNLHTTVKPPSRVQFIVSNVGTGTEFVKDHAKITVKYTGRLLNGTVFDSSTDGVEFNLDDVIKGWAEGLVGNVKVGGKIRLLIPSDLAYGKTSQTDGIGTVTIPGNSCLDFDIEVVSIATP